VAGTTQGLADTQAFVAELGSLKAHPEAAARSLFDPTADLLVARAPGRLDLMGGIADYSGSLVLQWPLGEATLAAAQKRRDHRVRLVSLGGNLAGRESWFETTLEALAPGGRPLSYDDARTLFANEPRTAWAGYVAGTLLVLMRELGARFDEGVALLVRSDVPEGKGVSSSAALEVAAMTAVAAAFGLRIPAPELALLCQKVENLVVGAPCGVMDQMTAACGKAGELLALLCQPAELQGTIALPEDLAVWGLDSGERHAVSGSDYIAVRVGAFMGARIVEAATGHTGPLADLTPLEFEKSIRDLLPATMRGSDFLAEYGDTRDPVTRVDPDRTYAVLQPTGHPVYEHARVRAFAELLAAPPGEARNQRLGELMHESHASYSACGLGSPATDAIVEAIGQVRASGFYGAKITGGGSGGTVAVLGRKDADIAAAVEAVARLTGRRPPLFAGSSPGAAAFGSLRLGPDR
jgi:L-arabinokinase